jgi:2'-5' RNA ligase
MNDQTLRAYVAVELPSRIHELLEERQRKLRSATGSASGAIRWTRPESVHVTLQFLGDVPESMVGRITAAMQDACAGARPLDVSLGGVGAFPNASRPRVMWTGLEGGIAELRTLAVGLSERLKALGYAPDKRFEPHITLGRVREGIRPDELRAISQALASQATQQPPKESFTVSSISLMQSHLQPGGAVYTQLATAQFGSTPK